MKKKSSGSIAFKICNYIILCSASLLCLLPFVNLFSVSLSSSVPVNAGKVTFFPIMPTLSSYQYVIMNQAFIQSFLVSLERLALGIPIMLFLILLTAYPLSKSSETFRARPIYAWFFILTMMLTPSLIPTYMVIFKLGLIDSIWALILPYSLSTFCMIVMLNFFRQLPSSLEEAAIIDGAGHWRILWTIYVPLSKPSIATVALFCIIFHWNSWFDGILYMNDPAHYPMQSYLQTVVINPLILMNQIKESPELAILLTKIDNKTAEAAQLFIAMIPVLVAYPFLQKHFTTGLVLGSVKE